MRFLGIQMEMKAEAWKQNAAPPSFIAPNLVYARLACKSFPQLARGEAL